MILEKLAQKAAENAGRFENIVINKDIYTDRLIEFATLFLEISRKEENRIHLEFADYELSIHFICQEDYLFYQDEEDLFSDGETFFVIKISNTKLSEEKKSELLSIFKELIGEYYPKGLGNDEGESNSEYPHPAVFLSLKGEILWQNNEFGKLRVLPQMLISSVESGSLEIGGERYQVISRSVNDSNISGQLVTLKNLYSFQKSMNPYQISKSELGVVSSSMAHELNNPIGGILAGIALCELEDELSFEVMNNLCEMKKSALRAKELVEIFLGFSRADPKRGELVSLKRAYDHALSLMRFRMVESNLRLDIHFLGSEEGPLVSQATVSMILYLIFGQLLTLLMRDTLVREKKNRVLPISLSFNPSGLVVSFGNEINLNDTSFKHSKLLNHLLLRTNFKLEVNDTELILSLGN